MPHGGADVNIPGNNFTQALIVILVLLAVLWMVGIRVTVG